MSQNLGISNLRLSYVIPARMSIKNLPTSEASFHTEGDNNNSCAKSIRETAFNNYLALTRKPVRIRFSMGRNVKIREKKKKKLYVLYTLGGTEKFRVISSTEKVAS